MPPSTRIICRISATDALVEREDGMPALDQLGRDVGLQIGESEDEVRLERFDLLEASRGGTTTPSASARASGGRTV